MRTMLCVFVLLSLTNSVYSQAGSKNWIVPGLELTEPFTRTKPGIAKVVAKVDTKDKTTKVVIKWKVRAQFEDSDVEFDYEPRDDGKSLQVVIPDSKGIIDVFAVAVVDGEPTEIACTTISVDYKARVQPAPQPQPSTPIPNVLPKENTGKASNPKQEAKGKVTKVYLVRDLDESNADIKSLMDGRTLKNMFKEAGVEPELVIHDSENYKKLGLDAAVKQVGAPCVIYTNERNEVVKSTKVTSNTTAKELVEGSK